MSIWDKALEVLEKRMATTAFNTWIKSIESIEEQDGKIVLEVTNKFQKTLIENSYLNFIKESLREITHKDISVLFTLSKTKEMPQHINQSQPILPEQEKPKSKQQVVTPMIPENTFFQKFTFENFIVGDSNRIAYSAALSASRTPGQTYNPLFLFGKRGVGKTHLIQSIGNYVLQHNLPFVVKYTTVDEFANDFFTAMKSKDFNPLNRKYRNNDILLVDDINLLGGKEANQNLFFHIFNALYLSGKQIVLTSDRPPKDLSHIQSRLINRFEQGLITEIQSPELELRQLILRKIAEKNQKPIGSKYIGYIASRITNDIRVLEGAMNRLFLELEINNNHISFELIDSVLAPYMKQVKQNNITIAQIAKKVAQYYKIPETLFQDNRKNKSVVVPRQMAMYIAMELTTFPVTSIAHYFNKSHSSVNYAQRKMKDMLRKDLTLQNMFDKIVADLKDNF